jgi:DNA-binding transcriptional regulator/RsmH inhibitor MraZ
LHGDAFSGTFLLVSSAGQSYNGFKPYTLDAKNRVAVQLAWRPPEGMAVYLLLSTTHGMPMLKVITQAGYDERLEIIAKSDLTEKEKRELVGILAANCRLVTINEQFKLSIPKDLCDFAQLKPETEIYQVGRQWHFEIWNFDFYEKAMQIERAMAGTDKLGIL